MHYHQTTETHLLLSWTIILTATTKTFFDFFDTDGDGYLVKSEINKLLDMLDIINATVDELELLIIVLENQDGRLSFGDFMNLLGC